MIIAKAIQIYIIIEFDILDVKLFIASKQRGFLKW